MKKMLVALSAVAALALGVGSVSAQTFTPAPGSGTIIGTLSLQQTLPFPISCTLNPIPVTIAAGGASATTAVTSFPSSLCSGGLGAGVTMTGNWTMTPIGVTQVQIVNITVNALGGTCAGSVTATVVSRGPNLILRIPRQSIPGNPVQCWIEGDVEVVGVGL